MAKVQIGDIVEFETSKGLAYAQYVNRSQQLGSLIRVFEKCRERRPTRFEDVVDGEVQFLCFFPLQAAVRRKVVPIVGHAPVPDDLATMPTFRSGTVDPATGKVSVWWLWDGAKEWRVDELSEEQRALPMGGIWNDTLIKERIESGWTAATDPTT